MLHPRFLTDRYRLIRSLLVGSLAYLVSIQFLGLKESFTLSVTCALAWDFIQLFRHTWLLSIEQTRSIFTRWESNESFVAVRTIALVFMSIGILSFCISDLQHSSSVLPKSIHTLTTFFALFLTWLQLHNGFAIYYAKSYFERNRTPLQDGEGQQAFIFEGQEPCFSDFIYVSYSIGLTYSMTDCSLEDSSLRRIVIIHCIASFLFYSTVLSMILAIITQV